MVVLIVAEMDRASAGFLLRGKYGLVDDVVESLKGAKGGGGKGAESA